MQTIGHTQEKSRLRSINQLPFKQFWLFEETHEVPPRENIYVTTQSKMYKTKTNNFIVYRIYSFRPFNGTYDNAQ